MKYINKERITNDLVCNKKERITIEISAELKKEVVVYCAENGIKSMKELITNLIEFALKKDK